MIPTGMLPHTASCLTPGSTTNTYGDQVGDWGYPTVRTFRCRIEQVAASETIDPGRDALVATYRIYANDLGIGGRDRVVVEGVTYEVVGPPHLVAGRSGTHHLEALLRVWDG